MSYVKILIIYKGVPRILEVHGSEMKIDIRKNPYGTDIPVTVNTIKEYEEWVASEKQLLSGTISDRFSLGIPVILSDEDKVKWLDQLIKMHMEGQSDDSNPYIFNSIIDMDKNIFYSMKMNWYADYKKYIPKDWDYKEITPQEMQTMFNKVKNFTIVGEHLRRNDRGSVSGVRSHKRRLKRQSLGAYY